jgi:hypothetical protein
VLIPNLPSLLESVSAGAATTFESDEDIESALKACLAVDQASADRAAQVCADALGWEEIGRKTEQFFRTVLKSHPYRTKNEPGR